MTRVDALCLLSTGHLLRILIPLEEPPHLTADNHVMVHFRNEFVNNMLIRMSTSASICILLTLATNGFGVFRKFVFK